MIITIVLEALTGKFNTDIDRSAKQAARDLKRLEAESKKALGDFGKIIAAAATTAAAGLGVMVKSAIDNADELGKLSQKVGVTVEDLSKLAYAAQLGDTDLASLQQSLVKLADSAVQAQTGAGDAAEAFKAIGVSVTDANGQVKDSQQLFLEISDAFAGFEDGAAKSAVATDIFGKAGANLIPLLNGGSEAIKEAGDELERFGGVISQDASDSANEFNDNIDKLVFAGKALAFQVAKELLPGLISLSERFLNLVKDGTQTRDVVSKISDAMGVLGKAAIAVGNAFEIAGQSIGGVTAALVAVATGDFSGALKILKEARADALDDLRDIEDAFSSTASAAEDAGKRISAAIEPSQTPSGQKPLSYDPAAAKKAAADAKSAAAEIERAYESATSALQGLLDSQGEQIAGFDGSKEAALQYRLTIGDLADEVALLGEKGQEFASSALEQARAVDSLTAAKEEQERVERQLRSESEEIVALQKELLPLTSGLDEATLEYAESVAKLQMALSNAAITEAQYQTGVQTAQKQLEDAQDRADKSVVFAEEAARGIQDAFAEFFFDPFEKGLSGLLDSVVRTLDKIASEIVASQLSDLLFGDGSGGSGGGSGGIFGSLFGAIGSIFSSGGGTPTARADGGPVFAGESYLVGERGAELFVPDVTGTIVPNAGSSINQTNNFYVSAPGGRFSQESQQQMASRIGFETSVAMSRNR